MEYGATKQSPSRVKAWNDVLPDSLTTLLNADIDKIVPYEATSGTLKDYKKVTRFLKSTHRAKTAIEVTIRYMEEIVKPWEYTDHYEGAEWWVQQVPTDQKGKIGFHLDKDESVASNQMRLVHPIWGSIMYLTNSGGCTLIFDQYSPTGNGYFPDPYEEGEMVCPEANKYAIFNGTYLHGVLPGRDDHRVAEETTRRTFLVNFWGKMPEPPNCLFLDHREVDGLKILSKKKAKKLMEKVKEDAANAEKKKKRISLKKIDLSVVSAAVPTYTLPIELPGGRVRHVPLPSDVPPHSTMTLIWGGENAARNAGEHEPKAEL